jgi:hypothetical protein
MPYVPISSDSDGEQGDIAMSPLPDWEPIAY